jgi:hypothetical protein
MPLQPHTADQLWGTTATAAAAAGRPRKRTLVVSRGPTAAAADTPAHHTVTHMTVPNTTPHRPSHSSSSSGTGGPTHTTHPHTPDSSSSSRLSLEWLRGCCVEDVRHFFTGALGLGRKSVGCVSLLTLRMRDFPVDVNVGRICARLGWIPLQVGADLYIVQKQGLQQQRGKGHASLWEGGIGG